MKLDSYWLDTAPPFVSACEGPVEGQADVVVIGGGPAGAASGAGRSPFTGAYIVLPPFQNR